MTAPGGGGGPSRGGVGGPPGGGPPGASAGGPPGGDDGGSPRGCGPIVPLAVLVVEKPLPLRRHTHNGGSVHSHVG
jgi:hypothetical protein